ncbi:hypothetical protein K450DRAFT_228021 [Umbelopsis ramanniana AG]|uniref:Fe2OG dioxygenase domain-containing protein n=1 Tax=Umbelopsis ramanniana AG TaxID=1314678 RepID=A0AAD5EF02_UMBRA|nr:uncharacterized protein K450DRAFT_228021 [Umbelopsis ramanniana AG]KAI8582234.1 hypothetical protein K450DRAFT_228021 [Umbelopsis ramanniana AG]
METLQPPAHLKSRRQKEMWKRQLLQNVKERQKAQESQTPFRIAERSLQSKVATPDRPPVVDFTNLENNPPEVRAKLIRVELSHDLREICPLFGRTDDDWSKRRSIAYIHSDIEGLIFIPNPFTESAQRQLIYNCLQKYTQAPNSSSLDAHYEVPAEGVWNLYTKSRRCASNEDDSQLLISRKSRSNNGQKIPESADPYDAPSTSGQQSTSIEKDPDIADIKSEPSLHKPSELLHPSELIRKLRWVSLGYQYNWSEKTYFFDRPIPVPEEAAKLSIAIAKAVEGIGYRQDDGFRWQNNYKGDNYAPEAGIVNYYQLKDTLMAHVDRSELNMEAPLISMSLGHKCIYLIGEQTRDIKPHAILLQSGDVMAMTGASRSAFHGVPKILDDGPSFLQPGTIDENIPDWDVYGEYVSKARINLNIRQVNVDSSST